jgi:hypothetical protein
MGQGKLRGNEGRNDGKEGKGREKMRGRGAENKEVIADFFGGKGGKPDREKQISIEGKERRIKNR